MAISPDGELLATGSADRTFKIWRTRDATLVGSKSAHERNLTDIVFHPHKPLLATSGQEGLVRFGIWLILRGPAITRHCRTQRYCPSDIFC